MTALACIIPSLIILLTPFVYAQKMAEQTEAGEIHPLQFPWTFTYFKKIANKSYEENTYTLGTTSSVEDFWRLYVHLRRPVDERPTVCDYHVFREGIRPMWEDEANVNGGKWIVRLKKGLAARYWEDVVSRLQPRTSIHGRTRNGARARPACIARGASARLRSQSPCRPRPSPPCRGLHPSCARRPATLCALLRTRSSAR